MLTSRAQFLAVLLTMIALIGCTQKNDYNIVIGIGLIYLGSRHSFLYNLTSFYLLIIFTVGVDILQIIMLTNQGTFMRYVLTAFQIVVKILILVVMAMKAKKQNIELKNVKRSQGITNQDVSRIENI